jgi:hypothetical protein
MGGYGMARCPAHLDQNPSLSVNDKNGKVLLKCHAGCSQQAVIAALRKLGLWPFTACTANLPPKESDNPTKPNFSKKSNTEIAQRIWNEATEIEGTPAERYLYSRSVTISAPPSLRYSPDCFYAPGVRLPAVVAGVQNSRGILTAIQRVYLRADGLGRAPVEDDKLCLGPMGDGAVRLGRASDHVLGLCEGWETGLSVIQLYEYPVWAVLGAGRMHRVCVPDPVRRLIIFADDDGPGREAATRTACLHEGFGRRVEIRFPSIGKDFNDELVGKGARP